MSNRLLSIVVDPKVKERLRHLARQQSAKRDEDIRMSDLVRQAIDEFIDKNKNKD